MGAPQEGFTFVAEEHDGQSHEEIAQQMWTILVALVSHLGGRMHLTAKELAAVEGVQARLHLGEDGSATVSLVDGQPMAGLPMATHESNSTRH